MAVSVFERLDESWKRIISGETGDQGQRTVAVTQQSAADLGDAAAREGDIDATRAPTAFSSSPATDERGESPPDETDRFM